MRFKLILLLCLALLFVWSVPGTIALRNFLLGSALVLLGLGAGWRRWRLELQGIGWPLGILAALTAWFVVQALAVSPETSWALAELRGQWLTALAALALGLLLALHAVRSGPSGPAWVQTGIIAVLGLEVAIPTVLMLTDDDVGGQFIGRVVPLIDGKLEMSFVVGLLLTFLAAEGYARLTGRQRLSAFGALPLALIALLTMTCGYLVGARNGVLSIAFLGLVLLVVFMIDGRSGLRRAILPLGAGVAVVAALALGLGYASYQTDLRWAILGKTAQVAWDIDGNRQWLDPQAGGWPRIAHVTKSPLAGVVRLSFPRDRRQPNERVVVPGEYVSQGVTALAIVGSDQSNQWSYVNADVSGWVREILVQEGQTVVAGQALFVIDREVDSSAYLRIAFIRAGMRILAEHPLGVGYGRNAFAHALRANQRARVGHAHSGWIDLGAGTGIPGMALWTAFLASLAWVGWKSFIRQQRAAGLVLLLLATGYAGRMVLDSVARDHMLQMFMFLTGLLLALTAGQRAEERQ